MPFRVMFTSAEEIKIQITRWTSFISYWGKSLIYKTVAMGSILRHTITELSFLTNQQKGKKKHHLQKKMNCSVLQRAWWNCHNWDPVVFFHLNATGYIYGRKNKNLSQWQIVFPSQRHLARRQSSIPTLEENSQRYTNPQSASV